MMGKYSPCLNIKQVCRLEIEETKAILQNYKVSQNDIDNITDMISNAYFQLNEEKEHSKNYDDAVKEIVGANYLDRIHKLVIKKDCDCAERLLFGDGEKIELPFCEEVKEWYEV